MNHQKMSRSELAQMAMMLEVCAYPKPGNVDRCHDYPDTRLEHFLASAILVRPVFERAERRDGKVGELIREAVEHTTRHSGGNTHFGAYILLIPLIMGGDIRGAMEVVSQTDTSDAVEFYHAFSLTSVRMLRSDELDVNDPMTIGRLKERGMTLLDVMRHSAPNDLVAREWTSGFALTRRAADLLHSSGTGRDAIVRMFMTLLATETDTFIVKKHGSAVAEEVRRRAEEVLERNLDAGDLDEWCIEREINPGSIADIAIAAIYVAQGEGWVWDS